MNKDITDALKTLGLSDNEIVVYLATLEVGNGSSLKISRQAGIPKSTTHGILLKLNKQGLVNQYPKKSRTYFSASDPEVLLRQVERSERKLKEVLPELKALHHSSRIQPHIRFYSGKEGVELLMMEVLKEADELRIITSQEDAEVRRADMFPYFPRKRAEAGIPARVIFKAAEIAIPFKKEDDQYLRKSKIIETATDLTMTCWMWSSKVAFVTAKESYSVTIIDDREIAAAERALFESMWQFHPEVNLN